MQEKFYIDGENLCLGFFIYRVEVCILINKIDFRILLRRSRTAAIWILKISPFDKCAT